jgi:hypothetical protein
MNPKASEHPSPRGQNNYFPLLCLNGEQEPDCPVLSSDGRTMLPKLPEGTHLVQYTPKELWLFEVAGLSDGYETIIESLHEALHSLDEAKEQMERLIARESQARKHGILLDVTSDEMSFPEAPYPDRRHARKGHLVLQLVCASEHDGYETGDRNFNCEKCNGLFALCLPNDSTFNANGYRNRSALRIGFIDALRLACGGTIRCPKCRDLTNHVNAGGGA